MLAQHRRMPIALKATDANTLFGLIISLSPDGVMSNVYSYKGIASKTDFVRYSLDVLNGGLTTLNCERAHRVQTATSRLESYFGGELGHACQGCGRFQPRMPKCKICQVPHYCNKVCQTRHWKAGHKALCPLLAEFNFADERKEARDGYHSICTLIAAYDYRLLRHILSQHYA